MEVSPFSFLNPDDYTNFYSIFQETQEEDIITKKRRRTEEQVPEEVVLNDVVATLLFLDEEQKSEQQQYHKSQSMNNDYSNQFHDLDSKGVFTDVCIGWPGSMPDDKILEKSALFQRANRGLLKDVLIAGNSGYPLMDWVLVPYTHKNLTWAQHAFNEKIGEVHGVAKEAFGRLKGRWTCLQKRTEVKLQDLPVVLGACCVLHNICEMRNEIMDPELWFDIFDDEMVLENSVRSVGAEQARHHIAHNLLHHNFAGPTARL
ncbi:hypothetical protein CsSME_00024765 [Camellia sinensis var. sinensis]